MQTLEPINLLEKSERYRQEFNEFITQRSYPGASYSTTSSLGFSKGDRIQFFNGYGIPMITEILGFDEEGKAYLLWDCYWFTIDLGQRKAVKLT